MWPNYSPACRKAVNDLLKKGGSLSAYRANKDYGVEPVKDSYAWRLEREVEKRFKVRHCVAVNSGTAALHAALASLDLRGGEVITSPYTFSATVSAILLAGGTPRFADVDPYTFCITPETVQKVITKRTVAILPVSIFGGMADVEGLKKFGLPVIEDACQAVGAKDQRGYSGSQAISACYSMNGGKNVPAGECGMAVTQDPDIAEHMRLVMNHGENFGSQVVGYNFRPNEVTCCIAYHGLLELEERNKRRIVLANEISKAIAYFGFDDRRVYAPHGWYCGKTESWYDEYAGDHVYYCYPFTLANGIDRKAFIKRMARRGVKVGAGYIQPTLNRYPAFRKYQRSPLPVVEELSSKTLCLLYDLTPDKPLSYAEHVADCMRKALE